MLGSLLYSFFLSQIFGLFLVITSILMLSRVEFYRKLVHDMKPDNSIIIVGGTIGLLLGLCLVDIHNIWVLKPRIVVTILCWIILIKSLLWLSAPEKMLSMTKKLYAGIGYYILVLFTTLFGVVLMARGFYLYIHL